MTTTQNKETVTAASISAALFLRHEKNAVCWREVYCGSKKFDAGPGNGILDFWAFEKSWAKPRYHGYEIKVTRGDFLRDDKWQDYLAVCNYFSFAVAPGVAEKSEVPEGVGLLVLSGNRFITARKPVFREVSKDQIFNVFKSRAMRNTGEPHQKPDEALELMKTGRWDMVKDNPIAREIQYERARMEVRERDVKDREAVLERRSELLDPAQKLIRELGLNEYSRPSEETILKAWKAQNGGRVPVAMARDIENTIRECHNIIQKLERIKEIT